MSTKIDTTSATGSQKVSKFSGKTGFVIPKNKLSGSLVPIFRGGKKLGASDEVSGESKKQVQRKTKWGCDLTQDADVIKRRALAYQTRVDQITKQLNSGISEIGNDGNLSSPSQNADHISSTHQIDKEDEQKLEHEKREAIGEILKLNPKYKAPPDYKPLLKEATVPIPVHEYPRYNFIGLIYGPGRDNQKQLEKETGAKIQVYATKSGIGEKVEINPDAGSGTQGEHDNFYVHVSADTYEKVDAAVAVIELLITSVSGNLAAVTQTGASVSGDDNAHFLSQGQDIYTHNMIPTTVVAQGPLQPVAGHTQTPPNVQFPYPGPFFSTGRSGTPMNLPSFTPMNSSRSMLNGPAHPSTNQPSLFGTPPALFPPRQHPPQVGLQPTYIPQTSPGSVDPSRNFSMMAPQPSSVQANISAPVTFRPPPTGQTSPSGPFVSSFPQPAPNHPPGSVLNWQMAPAGTSTGWSGRPQASEGFSYSTVPTFTSVPQHQVGPLSTSPITLAQPKTFMSPTPAPSSGLVISLPPPPQPRAPSTVPNFNPIKPAMVTAPSPGDFTFQPHRPQNSAFQTVPNQFSEHNAPPAGPVARHPALNFQLPMQNMTPQPGNQMSHTPAHISATNFARNSNAMPVSPRLSIFLDTNPVAPRTAVLPMRPGNFNPDHQMPNLHSPLHPRPGSHFQIQNSHRPQLASHQQFINNNPGGHQLYDPFSPTSNSTARR